MKHPKFFAVAALITGTGLFSQGAHAQLPIKSMGYNVSHTKTGTHYKASTSYPHFTTSTPLTRYVNRTLRAESMKDLDYFARDAAKDAGGDSDTDLDWESQDSAKVYFYAPKRLISIAQMSYAFTGGAHGNYGTTTRNFAILPGSSRPRELKLLDFYNRGASFRPRIEKLLLSKLRARGASFVSDGTVKTIPNTLIDNFVVEKDGLRWFFPPYSVASYAEGEQEVKLTIKELGPGFKAELLRS